MSKPDDIPQDVWDAAEIAAKEATRDAMRDPLMPYYITVTPYIARAITAAKTEEREACAREAERVGNFGDYKREELTQDFGQPRFDMMSAIASAIRNRT